MLKLLSCVLPAYTASAQCLDESHWVDIRVWLRLNGNLEPTAFLIALKLILLLLIVCCF